MISDIYVLAYSMTSWLKGQNTFHNEILKVLPECFNDHLPEAINFVSAEYKNDVLVDFTLQKIVSDMAESQLEPLLKRVDVESGYFHIRLEAKHPLSLKRNDVLEFIFSEIQASYITASFFCYLGNGEIHYFSRIHAENISEPVDDFNGSNIDYLAPFLKMYFYEGEIPDQYAGDIAKMMLVGYA